MSFQVDLLINNAGQEPEILLPDGFFLSKDNGRQHFSAIALKTVLPHMIERGSGHIVGVSSLAGKVEFPKDRLLSCKACRTWF